MITGMLAIKLQRIGKKHQPSYRLVVAVKKSKMIAPPVEDLGSYSSFTKTANFKKDRISYWIGVGAQPTLTGSQSAGDPGHPFFQKASRKNEESCRRGSGTGRTGRSPESSDGKCVIGNLCSA